MGRDLRHPHRSRGVLKGAGDVAAGGWLHAGWDAGQGREALAKRRQHRWYTGGSRSVPRTGAPLLAASGSVALYPAGLAATGARPPMSAKKRVTPVIIIPDPHP